MARVVVENGPCGGREWPVWWSKMARVVVENGPCGGREWPVWWSRMACVVVDQIRDGRINSLSFSASKCQEGRQCFS